MNESKCWSCARSYPLPDPHGCAKYRDGTPVYDKGIAKKRGAGHGHEYGVVTVTECSQYRPSRGRRPKTGSVLETELLAWEARAI